MPLDQRQVRNLLSSITNTREDEIDCDQCLERMAEFAETRLVGVDVPVALERIEAHLQSCPECAEEFELLLEVVRGAP